MAKKPENSRVPSAVGAIPVVGDLARSADQQARWMQEMVEQNARLVGQFPALIKSFNDAIERFNETVGRLDRATTRIESASKQLSGPMEKALKATTDTQRQVAVLQSTIERVIGALGELPGAAVLRRIVAGREDGESGPRPKPS